MLKIKGCTPFVRGRADTLENLKDSPQLFEVFTLGMVEAPEDVPQLFEVLSHGFYSRIRGP